MPRPEKVQAVADIKDRLENANAVFLAEYAGLSVKEQQELRRSLRDNGAEFKVVKMTLTKLAAAELELEELDELLVGPTGLAFADDDPAAVAKALDEFAGSHEVFAIKGGVLGRDFLTPERIGELAKIEPREVLLAMLAATFEAPMATMASLLAALPRDIATAMAQLIEKKESEEQAAPEPVAEAAEEPVAEAAAEPVAEAAEEPVAEAAAEPVAEAAAEPVAEAAAEPVAEAAADADSDSSPNSDDQDEDAAATAEEE